MKMASINSVNKWPENVFREVIFSACIVHTIYDGRAAHVTLYGVPLGEFSLFTYSHNMRECAQHVKLFVVYV